ncbi:MAG: hypothetical protein AAGG51_07305 [Cyanobacteria bacterium P01_G01_bin.54]
MGRKLNPINQASNSALRGCQVERRIPLKSCRREHLAHATTRSPKPGQDALWAKLQAQKAKHEQYQ